MTYGEAVMFQKSTMRMQNGVWVSDPLPAHVRLSEKEAFESYRLANPRKNLHERSDAKRKLCRLA